VGERIVLLAVEEDGGLDGAGCGVYGGRLAVGVVPGMKVTGCGAGRRLSAASPCAVGSVWGFLLLLRGAGSADVLIEDAGNRLLGPRDYGIELRVRSDV